MEQTGPNGWMLLYAALGLLFPRATVGGWFSPFGIGLAGAVGGRGSGFVTLTVSAGYLLFSGTPLPFSYVTAAVLIGGIRWTFSAFPKLIAKRWFSPLVTFLATAGVGILVGSPFGDLLRTTVHAVTEGLAAAGCTAVFRYLRPEPADETELFDLVHRLSLVLAGGTAFLAIGDISFSGISPARIAAGVVILLLADSAREKGGAIAGIVFGVSLVAATPEHWPLAAAFCFGGLAAGVLARFGKAAVFSGWVVCCGMMSLGGEDAYAIATGIYEAVASGILFAVAPRRWSRRLTDAVFGSYPSAAVDGFRRSVTVRLGAASRAMEEVSAAVDAVSRKLCNFSCSDLGTLYRESADEICRSCERRMTCWRSGFGDAMDSLNGLTPTLRQTGKVTPSSVKGYLARQCPRLDRLCDRISDGFSAYQVREIGTRRLAEIQTAVQNQFAGMSGVFSDVAAELSTVRRVDAPLAGKIVSVLERHRLPIVDAVCLIGHAGRMTVELLFADPYIRTERMLWLRDIAAVCGKTFSSPIVTPLAEGVKLTLMEAPRYTAAVGAARLTCAGETVCGDAYEYFTDEEGKLRVILSDGMGSGGRAAVDGALTAGLTARMLKGGFGIGSIVKILNAALMVKSQDETSATLDVLELDLFSGDLTLTKAGACSSVLVSGGRVSRIAGDSLPIGILQQTLYEQTDERMAAGDVLLMMSDGAAPEGDDWLSDFLPPAVAGTESMDALANAVCARARDRQEHRDDITVIAVKLEKANGR